MQADMSLADYKREMKADKRMNRPEQELVHKPVAAMLRHLAPIHRFWWGHYPAGGVRSKTEAAIFKGLGVVPGVADILIIPQGGKAHWIELKAPGRKAKTTSTQDAFGETMMVLGCQWAVCDSVEEVHSLLKKWGLINDRGNG